MQTIDEAKTFLRENWEKGIKCPCCGQMVKKYTRPLHYSMIICLIKLYKLVQARQDYYHVNDFGADSTNGGDFAKLKYWGLIVEKPKDPQNKISRTSGFWTVTVKGKSFLLNRTTVARAIFIYNKKKIGESEQQVTAQEALGKKFNYSDLMGDSI